MMQDFFKNSKTTKNIQPVYQGNLESVRNAHLRIDTFNTAGIGQTSPDPIQQRMGGNAKHFLQTEEEEEFEDTVKNHQNYSIQAQRDLILNNLHLFRSENNQDKFYVIETSALEAYCENYIGLDIDNFRIKTLDEPDIIAGDQGTTNTPKPLERVEGLLGRLQD